MVYVSVECQLLSSVWEGDMPAVQKMLDMGLDINVKGFVCAKGRLCGLQYSSVLGKYILTNNRKSRAEGTPLHFALVSRREDMVRFLLNRNADWQVRIGTDPTVPTDPNAVDISSRNGICTLLLMDRAGVHGHPPYHTTPHNTARTYSYLTPHSTPSRGIVGDTPFSGESLVEREGTPKVIFGSPTTTTTMTPQPLSTDGLPHPIRQTVYPTSLHFNKTDESLNSQPEAPRRPPQPTPSTSSASSSASVGKRSPQRANSSSRTGTPPSKSGSGGKGRTVSPSGGSLPSSRSTSSQQKSDSPSHTRSSSATGKRTPTRRGSAASSTSPSLTKSPHTGATTTTPTTTTDSASIRFSPPHRRIPHSDAPYASRWIKREPARKVEVIAPAVPGVNQSVLKAYITSGDVGVEESYHKDSSVMSTPDSAARDYHKLNESSILQGMTSESAEGQATGESSHDTSFTTDSEILPRQTAPTITRCEPTPRMDSSVPQPTPLPASVVGSSNSDSVWSVQVKSEDGDDQEGLIERASQSGDNVFMGVPGVLPPAASWGQLSHSSETGSSGFNEYSGKAGRIEY